MVLSGWDGPVLSALWFKIAAVVGISRAYVRIHHGSDVVGGVVVVAAGICTGGSVCSIYT